MRVTWLPAGNPEAPPAGFRVWCLRNPQHQHDGWPWPAPEFQGACVEEGRELGTLNPKHDSPPCLVPQFQGACVEEGRELMLVTLNPT